MWLQQHPTYSLISRMLSRYLDQANIIALCHPSNLNDLVSYEEDDYDNENLAVQKKTPRMHTVKSPHWKFSLLDVVTGLNVKEHFTSFSSPEDLNFQDWWSIGSLFLRSYILAVDSIILDEAKGNKLRVRGDKTGSQGYSLTGEASQGFQKCYLFYRVSISSGKPTLILSFPLLPHATDMPVFLNCAYSVSPYMHPFIMFMLMGKFTIHTVTYKQNFSGVHLCWIEGYLLSENILLKCTWMITGSKQNETILRDSSGRCEEFIEPYCGNEMVDFQHLTKTAGWWSHSEKCV